MALSPPINHGPSTKRCRYCGRMVTFFWVGSCPGCAADDFEATTLPEMAVFYPPERAVMPSSKAKGT